jgi:hypothetical protein
MRHLLVVAFLVLALTPAALAGVSPEVAIALHVTPEFTYCDLSPLPDCMVIQTHYQTLDEPVYIYVMICGHGWDGDGFMGATYGLTWPAEWGPAIGWWDCSDFSIGEILNPGDWISQTWGLCQLPLGRPEAAGILGLVPTTPGRVEVTTSGETGTAEVLDCHLGIDIVLPCDIGNGRAGWVSVQDADGGCNPCPCVGPPCYLPPSATVIDTWSSIKALFE